MRNPKAKSMRKIIIIIIIISINQVTGVKSVVVTSKDKCQAPLAGKKKKQ